MPEIPRTKFNSPWTVAVIEAALNDVSSAKGSSESLTAALNAMRAEINSLSGGVHLKGAVDYYNNLPVNPSEGDAYTVRYQGTSGTDPLGIEYAWATYQGTPQWIPIGVDPSVFAKQTEMDVVANAGAKNFASKNSGSGTNSTAIPKTPITLPVGDYICSFSASSYSGNAAFELWNASNSQQYVKELTVAGSNSFKFTVTGAMSVAKYSLYVNNATISDFMIRPAAITDPTFQPYAKTNRELTVLTDEDRASLVELVDGGSKNLLNNQLGSGTKSGLAYTTGTDGSIVITAGTPTANADFVIPFTPKESGQYVLQGCPSGGSGTTFKGQITLYPSMTNVVEIFDNTSVTTTLTGGTQYAYRFRVYSGKEIGDVTIYPMVCSEAARKISQTYQPYRPSYQELYEMILALQNGTRSLAMSSEPEVAEQPEESEER